MGERTARRWECRAGTARHRWFAVRTLRELKQGVGKMSDSEKLIKGEELYKLEKNADLWVFLRLTALIGALVLAMIVGAEIATSSEVIIIHNGYFKGNQYVSWKERDRAIYIAGIVDGILLSSFFGAKRSEMKWFERCTIDRMDSYQVTAIVDKFMRKNPERWHESIHNLAYFAIKKACKK
jgi:hypothetical protein